MTAYSPDAFFAAAEDARTTTAAALYATGALATSAPGRSADAELRCCIDCGDVRHWSGDAKRCPRCRHARLTESQCAAKNAADREYRARKARERRADPHKGPKIREYQRVKEAEYRAQRAEAS